MSLAELTEFIVKSLVKDVDKVIVRETFIDDFIKIDVSVSNEDVKRVIGRDGKVIQSIRTLVQEASTLRDNKYVKVEIENSKVDS